MSPIETLSPATAESVEVRPGTPDQDEARDAFVLAHPYATFFHLAGWRRVVTRLFRYVPHDLYAWRGDELVGVLPLVRCPSFLGRRRLLSMPFATYGGPLGADLVVAQRLVEEACRLAERLRVGYLELRNWKDPGVDMLATELYWTFQRELPDEPSEVLARMPKKARAEARKARKQHDLELTQGVWYVDDLSRLFLLNKRALGSPALSRKYFYELLKEFGDRVVVHLVHRHSEPLAAVMSFCFRDTLIAYHSGTAPGADRAYSASNFMFMALQEWATEHGYKVFDFCRSRGDSGAFQFKRHQGFEPILLPYRYHLVRSRSLSGFTPSNPKTAPLRATWSRLPLSVARLLSIPLARYFC